MDRKIKWISSLKKENQQIIAKLKDKLHQYYRLNANYYTDIDFTETNWRNNQELSYSEIVKESLRAEKILEIGCGSANILKYHDLQQKYAGVDFSELLIQQNSLKYPNANFTTFKKYNQLPFGDHSFDFVFSVFVLEHSVSPKDLLDEMQRVTKPSGTLIIFCPDFLGRNRMTSQLSGLSIGSGSEKLKKGKFIDSLITGWDNKIKIPLVSITKKFKTFFLKDQGFYINVKPICFYSSHFEPDYDAVYLTYKKEIETYLSKTFLVNKNSKDLTAYEFTRKYIFIRATKKIPV